MGLFYHGTNLEFHNQQVRKYGKYSQKISLFKRIFASDKYFGVSNDDLFVSDDCSFALSFALMRSKRFNLTPIILIIDPFMLASHGFKAYRNPKSEHEFIIKRGALDTELYKVVVFTNDEAEKLLYNTSGLEKFLKINSIDHKKIL